MYNNTMNGTPSAERIHIGFFGCTNAGKSSLINALTNQEVSIVSEIKGTTTDPVKKAMELLPLGAVMLYDTAGLDDETELGLKRKAKTLEVLRHTDIAVIVIDKDDEIKAVHKELIEAAKKRKIPYIIAYSKCDNEKPPKTIEENSICVSAETGRNLRELKELIARVYIKSRNDKKAQPLIEDLIGRESLVLLVTPIDESAPKGRLILPQVQTIRAALDSDAVCIAVQPEQLRFALSQLKTPPDLVITDSQAFGMVKDIVPEDVPLTSFSILMARHKGVLPEALKGIDALRKLRDGDCILISEGCTHHRQCGDIGTVKLPGWISEYTGKKLRFDFTSGGTFPEDMGKYVLVVHCGGCMLNSQEMNSRRTSAASQGVPFLNFGMVIAEINGILERSLSFLKR